MYNLRKINLSYTLCHAYTTIMARRTKEEAEATRLKLMEAASTLFSKQGVATTTLLQVANEAGLSRGAIYWHFQNKDDLFQALMQRVVASILQRSEEVSQDGNDPLHQLHVVWRLLLDATVNDPDVHRIFEIAYCKMEYVQAHAPARIMRHSSRQNFLDLFAAAMRSASAHTRPDIDIEHTAIGLHAMLDGLIYNWYLCPQDTRYDLITVGMHTYRCYLLGLGIPPEQLPD